RIPDAIIYLPEEKHIIIDSKVSLVAYERMVNSESEIEKQKELKLHLISLKSHIKELSDKKYFNTRELNSPEFTLLFLPIEASFSVALKEDSELFHYAWDRNIILVSPTTLLATLRTVASIWKHEKQTKHVLEIAKEGGALHDKFVAFVDDLQKIEKGIHQSQAAYSTAFNKLSSGKGNLVNRTNKLKILGAKAQKALSSDLIEQAHISDLEPNINE
ncbi:MAG: DNA recombination protein RmuC, partial [Salibacteraceae bacterium]